jgi:DNA-binding Lrp family transcriptional regulator
MMRAYVFIETRVGMARRVAEKLGCLSLTSGRVLAVDTVTGPFDIIVVVEGLDPEGIGRAIAEEMHKIDGIEKTMSCLGLKP